MGSLVRWRLLLAILVLFGALLPAGAIARQTATQSPPSGTAAMFRGGPARTGEHPGPGPSGYPVVRWSAWLGLMIGSTPAVADGIVYVGSISPLFRDGGALHALDAATGLDLWRARTVAGDGYFSSPAVADGTVYVGSHYGIFLAVDAATGEERWRFQAVGPIYSSPAVHEGTVYFGDAAGNLYALDAESGNVRWRFVDGESWERYVNASPAIAGGSVYAVGVPRRRDGVSWLYALDAATGAERWRYTAAKGKELNGTPAVADGLVYVPADNGFLYAVQAEDGRQRWSSNVGHATPTTNAAVADGVVSVLTDNGYHHAIDAASGQRKWSLKVFDKLGVPFAGGPIVADGLVYFTDADGYLYVADRATGALQWSIHLVRFGSSPVVVDGMVFIGSERGVLYALGNP